uniref:Uncharacterized protein n=1 Tax=Arundo donax TaxID=35708 RepID=A0A0A9G7Z0_ARUDO
MPNSDIALSTAWFSRRKDLSIIINLIRFPFVDMFRSFADGDFDRPTSSNTALSSSLAVSFSKLESECALMDKDFSYSKISE